MRIPDYQIHNILKDFTQRLKNGNHRTEAGCQLESVVNKVAGSIMRRVVHLSEEEAQRHQDLPSGNPAAAGERPPKPFHYHTMGDGHGKQLRRLALEDSEKLIDRFQSLVDAPEHDPTRR